MAEILLFIFGFLAILPLVLLFTQYRQSMGVVRSGLLIAAFVGFVTAGIISFKMFGIWIVIFFPIGLFALLFAAKVSRRKDTSDRIDL